MRQAVPVSILNQLLHTNILQYTVPKTHLKLAQNPIESKPINLIRIWEKKPCGKKTLWKKGLVEKRPCGRKA